MKYYKIIQGEKIIDAIADPCWVKQNENNLIVRCEPNEAMGIVSSDMSTILHISGTKEFSDGNEYQDVFVADISAEEYDKLVVLLGLGAEVPDDGGDVGWNDDNQDEEELPEDATLQEVKERYLEKLSDVCQQTIYNGVDVELSDGSVKHFDLQVEDQLNLLTLSALAASGQPMIPYHAKDELCTYYSSEDINKIVETATAFKTYHTTYFNSLKNWVMSMKSIAEVGAVTYGASIPEEYCSDILLGIINAETDGDADASGE